jgi:hypothetical protein
LDRLASLHSVHLNNRSSSRQANEEPLGHRSKMNFAFSSQRNGLTE